MDMFLFTSFYFKLILFCDTKAYRGIRSMMLSKITLPYLLYRSILSRSINNLIENWDESAKLKLKCRIVRKQRFNLDLGISPLFYILLFSEGDNSTVYDKWLRKRSNFFDADNRWPKNKLVKSYCLLVFRRFTPKTRWAPSTSLHRAIE
jgi:hypothetical protein